ncbi:MAG: hypothetical protein HYV27_20990 [Candidatus Hydrogenedentes bacterium]|nr:hypothetical protein [Candidatus Hydrogenedentota bacterium]
MQRRKSGSRPKGTQGGDPENTNGDPENAHFKMYQVYSNTLRTWFVAYGIGAPVLLISKEASWKLISCSSHARTIGILFLAGVALQVFLAMLNKNIMWMCYRGDGDELIEARRWYKFSAWCSEQYTIDMFMDIAALGCFMYATYLTYSVLMIPVAAH